MARVTLFRSNKAKLFTFCFVWVCLFFLGGGLSLWDTIFLILAIFHKWKMFSIEFKWDVLVQDNTKVLYITNPIKVCVLVFLGQGCLSASRSYCQHILSKGQGNIQKAAKQIKNVFCFLLKIVFLCDSWNEMKCKFKENIYIFFSS